MSISSTVSLGALRLQAQQRADVENSPVISTPEWNQYISQSYKELYDMLVSAYGNDYYVAALYTLTLTGAQYYNLPADFYKLLGVDLPYSGSPTGYVSLRRFEEAERNRFGYPNTTVNYLGYTNLKYRVSGSSIEFIPIPTVAQSAVLKYVPEPTSLQYMPTCSTTVGSTSVGVGTASSVLVAGMSLYGPGIQSGTTITAVNTTTNIATISLAALSTQAVVILQSWVDSTTMDGISGWEEYIIVDAAIKAKIKQEEDVTELRIQKAELKARIESMAEGRDIGQAHHVQDVLGMGGYGEDGMGGGGGWDY